MVYNGILRGTRVTVLIDSVASDTFISTTVASASELVIDSAPSHLVGLGDTSTASILSITTGNLDVDCLKKT